MASRSRTLDNLDPARKMRNRIRLGLAIAPLACVALILFLMDAQAREYRARASAFDHDHGPAEPSELVAPRRPQMGDFPDFALVDQRGARIRTSDLLGHPWVLQFFFACCDNSCPTMVRQIAELQREQTDPTLRFVSISVDPQRDTPERVTAHATRFAELTGLADLTRWSLLTGDRTQIVKLLQDCRLPVSPTALEETGPLGHVDRFFLVDRAGRIRGIYAYDDATRMGMLAEDLVALLAERIAHTRVGE